MADVEKAPTVTRAPLTVVVLTLNEAANIEACLASVRDWAAAVFVVDSGSSDDTVALSTGLGAVVVEHSFETHARQWEWALEQLPIETDWVLGLDADQRVTAELQSAITQALNGDVAADVAGWFINRRQIFRGRWIRHGGYYPKYLLKLFRRDRVSVDAEDLVDHHFRVNGTTRLLAGDLIEDNRNEAEIRVWVDKHNRYARLQAQQELAARKRGHAHGALFGTPDERVTWLKARWAQLPLFVRPCLYFIYRYVFRLGFLDGREGFVFHVLQGFWYRLLVDINMSELSTTKRLDASGPDEAGRR